MICNQKRVQAVICACKSPPGEQEGGGGRGKGSTIIK